mmetsp:Transcript_14364/g.33753  ORF Transcript_14364/g.33753 Transcript_14364/m.33753 type:complete len:292 (-) Transcript_14364:343-1218(-)
MLLHPKPLQAGNEHLHTFQVFVRSHIDKDIEQEDGSDIGQQVGSTFHILDMIANGDEEAFNCISVLPRRLDQNLKELRARVVIQRKVGERSDIDARWARKLASQVVGDSLILAVLCFIGLGQPFQQRLRPFSACDEERSKVISCILLLLNVFRHHHATRGRGNSRIQNPESDLNGDEPEEGDERRNEEHEEEKVELERCGGIGEGSGAVHETCEEDADHKEKQNIIKSVERFVDIRSSAEVSSHRHHPHSRSTCRLKESNLSHNGYRYGDTKLTTQNNHRPPEISRLVETP